MENVQKYQDVKMNNEWDEKAFLKKVCKPSFNKDETSGNVITESYHIQAKSYHYVLADKSTQSKYKRVSKRGMSKMATDSYISTLEGSLLDDLIDKSQNKKLRIWLCVLRQIL